MTAAALVAELRARGVSLEPEGDRLRVRPTRLVRPEELAALRQHKAEVLALLVHPSSTVTLDPKTVAEALGPDTDNPQDRKSVV